MASLDHELSRLIGKVSQITTKINEDGQKVKVIKITKNRKNMGDEEQQKLQEVLEKVRNKVHKNIKKNIDTQKSKIER